MLRARNVWSGKRLHLAMQADLAPSGSGHRRRMMAITFRRKPIICRFVAAGSFIETSPIDRRALFPTEGTRSMARFYAEPRMINLASSRLISGLRVGALGYSLSREKKHADAGLGDASIILRRGFQRRACEADERVVIMVRDAQSPCRSLQGLQVWPCDATRGMPRR